MPDSGFDDQKWRKESRRPRLRKRSSHGGAIGLRASFETPRGIPIFRMKSQPDPDFTPEQRATAAKAAGVVVSMDADSRGTFAPGRATSPSDGPEVPPEGRWGLYARCHRTHPGGGMTADIHAPMSAFRQITSARPPEADIPASMSVGRPPFRGSGPGADLQARHAAPAPRPCR